MNVRLGDERTERLRAAAAEEGRSMNDTIARAIDEYLERRAHIRRREAAIDRIVSKNAELNDLLAQ
jgi:predicted DNA-binding protein